MREGDFKDGKKHGPWTLYYPNGNKKSEATFSEGKYVGLYTSFHPNGNRRWQGRYNEITGTSADGTKDGVWLDYAEDGETVKRRMTYKRGAKRSLMNMRRLRIQPLRAIKAKALPLQENPPPLDRPDELVIICSRVVQEVAAVAYKDQCDFFKAVYDDENRPPGPA